MRRKLCIVESPFHSAYIGDTARNMQYLWRVCRDSYERGEQPFASHGFYPQFMDDENPTERTDGINFGYRLWELDSIVAFYCDHGWSRGMIAALDYARTHKPTVELHLRVLYGTASSLDAPKMPPTFSKEVEDFLLYHPFHTS